MMAEERMRNTIDIDPSVRITHIIDPGFSQLQEILGFLMIEQIESDSRSLPITDRNPDFAR